MAGVYDLAIVGGGINGCGIARDAAGRGCSVYLCEQKDLGSGTSSASTKLIHGGLRYLEYYEFRLVREALREREVLWRMAPHIIWPLRFVLPHLPGLRPSWFLRLGLFLYDHLGGREKLPGTRGLDLRNHPAGKPLKPGFGRAFEYSDCWVNDARLVVLNAQDAARMGAAIRTRTRFLSAVREDGLWTVTVEDTRSGRRSSIRARALVNAAGPWVSEVMRQGARSTVDARIRLVQGSHIVVPKLFDHDRCYIFQNADKRIVFAIPYERDFTLIGTTDNDYQGDPADVRASEAEIAYLCAAAGEYFAKPVTPADVVWTYSGVRPLYDDGASTAQAATRDYVLALDAPGDGKAALLNIFGGKITTYRRLADAAIAKLAPFLPKLAPGASDWSSAGTLPGGDFPVDGVAALVAELRGRAPFLTQPHLERLVRTYGTRARRILDNAARPEDLGRDFGATLTEAEVRYLMTEEWAETAEDVLWRRTKLGLRLDAAQAQVLDAFMTEERSRRERASDAAE